LAPAETLRIPLLRGRLFTDADGAMAQRVVVVNESLVRRFFPDGDVLGKNVTFDNPIDSERSGPPSSASSGTRAAAA